MKYQEFGRTGIAVSSIGLGTVSLGLDYGIRAPEQFGCPSENDSIRLIQAAADAGINFFDTAPGYGKSEYLLGKALKSYPECYIATKVAIPEDAAGNCLDSSRMRKKINESLANSLRALDRDVLDIVQIHNATVEIIRQREMAQILMDARSAGKIRFLGASVYTEDEALAAIDSNCFDVLQVAYNMLDQKMKENVFPAAQSAGVGIITRSAFLKGALTSKAQSLPESLAGIKRAAENAKYRLAAQWHDLPEIALRFCLSSPYISSVLLGPRTGQELEQALKAAAAGSLTADSQNLAQTLALKDQKLLNPSYWPIP